jgi:hypothetical protein
MTKTAFALILLLLTSLVAGFGTINFASANPDGSFPNLAMPIEYVNYTVTIVNGSLWATVDGYYPISIINGFDGDLPSSPVICSTLGSSASLRLKPPTPRLKFLRQKKQQLEQRFVMFK